MTPPSPQASQEPPPGSAKTCRSGSPPVPSENCAEDVAVLVGRFAPLHRADLEVLQAALSSYRMVVVVLGSAFQAPSPANPFTWRQRADMIGLCLDGDDASRVRFAAVRDYQSDERWADDVSRCALAAIGEVRHRKLVLVNPVSAQSREPPFDWVQAFPRWGHEPLRPRDRGDDSMDSVTIRNVLFSAEADARQAALAFLKHAVPDPVRHYLSAWWESPLRAKLAEDADWIVQYRKRWPVEQAMTTDAVVTCSNHVLLIERGEGAGAGLFAVPGGFLDKHERFYDGARRELREETGLGYIGDGLDVAFVRAEVFDRPHRSLRARIVTVAHLFALKATPLPDVQGRDDARHALWVPVTELLGMEDRFFEDHFQILDHFLQLTCG